MFCCIKIFFDIEHRNMSVVILRHDEYVINNMIFDLIILRDRTYMILP